MRVFLVFAIVHVAVVANAADVEQLIASGSQLAADKPDEAIATFGKAAALRPKDPRPYFLRAEVEAKTKNVKAAEADYKKALALDGKLAAVRAELGALYNELQRYDDAVKVLEPAANESASAAYNLGMAHLRSQKCEPAVKALTTATKLDSTDVEAWVSRSAAERLCKNLDAAKSSAEMAVKLGPDKAAAQTNLGLTLAARKEDPAAYAALERATKLDAQNATAFWTLGVVARRQKRWPESVAALERAIAIAGKAKAIGERVDLGLTYAQSGKHAEAASTLRAVLADDPKQTNARYHLVQVLCIEHDAKAAESEAAKLPTDLRASDKVKALLAQCK